MSAWKEFWRETDRQSVLAFRDTWYVMMMPPLMPIIISWRWYRAAKTGQTTISIEMPRCPI